MPRCGPGRYATNFFAGYQFGELGGGLLTAGPLGTATGAGLIEFRRINSKKSLL